MEVMEPFAMKWNEHEPTTNLQSYNTRIFTQNFDKKVLLLLYFLQIG